MYDMSISWLGFAIILVYDMPNRLSCGDWRSQGNPSIPLPPKPSLFERMNKERESPPQQMALATPIMKSLYYRLPQRKDFVVNFGVICKS